MSELKQPNILFIMADQMPAAFVNCYGSGVDSTPTLDALAQRGVRFNRCYAHVPVCAPNRATIFTGRSSEYHGVVTNNLSLPAEDPTWPKALQRAGYRMGGFGKFHLTPMQWALPENMNYLGFDESVATEDPKLGPWLDWVEREHPEHYEAALAVSWHMPYDKEYGKSKRNITGAMSKAREEHLVPRMKDSEWHLMYPSPLPAEVHQTAYITDLGIDFIERHLQNSADNPFCCFISYVDPHDPYDPPAPYDKMFNPDDMPPPIPMTQERHSAEVLEKSRDFHNFREVSKSVSAVQKLRALYHGSIRFIDDQIDRMLTALDARGVLDQTIIVFTTDHGDMMGDHGLITKGVKHYDKGIRCPLIVSGPSVGQGISERLTSSLDFFPTVCDWAEARERPALEGHSFAREALNPGTDPGWTAVTVQSCPYSEEFMTRSIITDDGWRFTIFDEDGQGEMFNLNEDPEERHNLYYDSQYVDKRLELFERHVRAYITPMYTYCHRVMPLRDGVRYEVPLAFTELEPLAWSEDKETH